MQKSTSPNNSFDEGPSAETAPGAGIPQAGDADAVEKTTYVVGEGTDDRANNRVAEVERGAANSASEAVPEPNEPPVRRGTDGDVPPTRR